MVTQDEKDKHKDEDLLTELDQLSLTDDDFTADLQELKDLESSEISKQGAGKAETKFINNTSIDEVINKSFLSHLTSARASKTKRCKIIHYAPITFRRVQTTLRKPKTAGIKILFDSGSTKTHIKRDFVQKL